MKQYRNSSGKSGVMAYEIGTNYIKIRFQGNETYLYNDIKPGKKKLDRMKQLAEKGIGLSTYISQHVKDNYYRKSG